MQSAKGTIVHVKAVDTGTHGNEKPKDWGNVVIEIPPSIHDDLLHELRKLLNNFGDPEASQWIYDSIAQRKVEWQPRVIEE